VGALVAGCVLWPAPPHQPVASVAPAHTPVRVTPVYGPPLPAQVTAASLGLGRVTPYPPASVQVLLSAGDRAQQVGHPRQAVAFYDQILRENPGDPRAAEAAFISGRLLLHSLDRPRQAAERFAQARRLAPHGPMAEDALAQEIASWARAGQTARARARAEEFRALYPTAPLPELIDVQGG
jgi:outer membrane protein assembly factor BamD (BamD/ComL family)